MKFVLTDHLVYLLRCQTWTRLEDSGQYLCSCVHDRGTETLRLGLTMAILGF